VVSRSLATFGIERGYHAALVNDKVLCPPSFRSTSLFDSGLRLATKIDKVVRALPVRLAEALRSIMDLADRHDDKLVQSSLSEQEDLPPNQQEVIGVSLEAARHLLAKTNAREFSSIFSTMLRLLLVTAGSTCCQDFVSRTAMAPNWGAPSYDWLPNVPVFGTFKGPHFLALIERQIPGAWD